VVVPFFYLDLLTYV